MKPTGAVQDTSAVDSAVEARIGKPPKESDFSDWFDYRDAKAAYEAEKRVVTRELNEASTRQQRAQVERISTLADDYQDNLKDAAEQIPDLIDTLTKSKFQPSKTVELLILEAGEKAPLVSHKLAAAHAKWVKIPDTPWSPAPSYADPATLPQSRRNR